MNEKNLFIGIDTSCYTTSAACVSAGGILTEKRQLLSVGQGERGLRQSDAVFQHIKNAEHLLPELLSKIDTERIAAVGVSVCPSGRADSYMPVFLVGKLLAKTLATALNVPVYGFTHQQGHIRAALFGNEELMGKRFMAFHLSGGTSELLSVDEELNIEKIGGTTDINAGQLVDRLGVKMRLPFPAGKALESLAENGNKNNIPVLPACVRGLECSFSGVETKAEHIIDEGCAGADMAAAVYDCIARTLAKLILNAREERGNDTFLLAGGVASSARLRRLLSERLKNKNIHICFAAPELSSDNAVGAALLCMDKAGKMTNAAENCK